MSRAYDRTMNRRRFDTPVFSEHGESSVRHLGSISFPSRVLPELTRFMGPDPDRGNFGSRCHPQSQGYARNVSETVMVANYVSASRRRLEWSPNLVDGLYQIQLHGACQPAFGETRGGFWHTILVSPASIC